MIRQGGYNNGYEGMYNCGYMMIPTILLSIILLIIIVYWVAKFVRHKNLYDQSFNKQKFELVDNTSKALEILNIKYANSEIDEEEYTHKKEQILK